METPEMDPNAKQPDAPQQPVARTSKENILYELCISNGIPYKILKEEEVFHAKFLEAFFTCFTLSQMQYLECFPNLTTLYLVGQSMPRIRGVETLRLLQELWICEADLEVIDGLSNNTNLRKLYLYCNKIRKIENLNHLAKLEVLWLCSNRIKAVEGLHDLKDLRELNLADNNIMTLDQSLNALTKLKGLNISGNRITSFKELFNLSKLPALRNLDLWDISYTPNPICLLCNYMALVLYTLPNLVKLDNQDVTGKSLRASIVNIITKKRMYYTMCKKTLEKKAVVESHSLEEKVKQLLTIPRACIAALALIVQEADRQLSKEGKQNAGEESSEVKAHKAKQVTLKDRMQRWEGKVAAVVEHLTTKDAEIRRKCDIAIAKLSCEMQSGGNITFEDGTSNNPWYTVCEHFVSSRFNPDDFKPYGFNKLRVKNVTRVQNPLLISNFENHLHREVQDDDIEVSCNIEENTLDYLFYVFDPTITNEQIMEAVVDGFHYPDYYQKVRGDAGVPLASTLYLCDRKRLDHALEQVGCDNEASGYISNVTVLVCEVLLGERITQHFPKRAIKLEEYPVTECVYRVNQVDRLGVDECSCENKGVEWFIFNPEQVLPEYLVQVEYTNNKIEQQEKQFSAIYLELENLTSDVDDNIIAMKPVVTLRDPMSDITPEFLLKDCAVADLQSITDLNLHALGLTQMSGLGSLKNLTNLIVTCNELTSLQDLSNITSLETVDASFNKITTLEHMKNLCGLKSLNVDRNMLNEFRVQLAVLRKQAPLLEKLSLKENPLNKRLAGDVRLRIIGRLKGLTELNGEPVTEDEVKEAFQFIDHRRVTQSLLQSGWCPGARTELTIPPWLSLNNNAQLLFSICKIRAKADNVSKITSLCFDGQKLGKLSDMGKLVNLKYASFNNNQITKIEGLEECCHLEELAMEHNCITRVEGLSTLQKLQSLHLAHNEIASVDATVLGCLRCLTYLSLEDNRIASLAGLEKVTTLVELYFSNNLVANISEIPSLKSMTFLWVLDLSENPVSVDKNYRLHVAYFVQSLKMLDGERVSEQEIEAACHAFGGWLSLDMLAEQLGHRHFDDVLQLDLVNLGIRHMDSSMAGQLTNLRSLNMENNNLTTLAGIECLVNLKVLCVNNNKIENIQEQTSRPGSANSDDGVSTETVMPSIEVLHIASNGITDMVALKLGCVPNLTTLFLQGNEITVVKGLEQLRELKELVLDRNKIKLLTETSFCCQWKLQELHMEENRVKDLTFLTGLDNLEVLFLSGNRIEQLVEVQKLESLSNLRELSVVNNSVSRKLLHRPLIVFRQPNIEILDGIPVTPEERMKADLYFSDQPVRVQIHRDSLLCVT
ncbi:PREDICTED: leucine-rich repeat-containing protein 9-like, partial [Priapulus caudatus]|uniref:Leucine-rich repeat-containing protein 9-like n=1 Tax=Priapulus caudatus TaxID=37621 RepID=A0ABM1EER4_PRICU